MAAGQTRASERSRVGHKVIEGTLSASVLQFNLAGEIDRLHRDDSWLHATGRSSTTLVKYVDLRIVLIAMKPGTRMHEHTAAGRISVHTLHGHIRLHLPGQVVDLPAGHILALDQCVPHDVEAADESAFLLTLSWPQKAETQEAKTARKKPTRHKR